MPYGKIDKYTEKNISLVLETGDSDVICDFPITDKVYNWMHTHNHQYKQGAIIEYTLNKDQTIGKVNLAKATFDRGTALTRTNEQIVNEKLKQAGVPPNPDGMNVTPATIPKNPGGMYDENKVFKVSIGCTISLHNWENIKVEVEAADPETARRCLIETLSVDLPLQSAVAKECVNRYLNAVLVKPPVV